MLHDSAADLHVSEKTPNLATQRHLHQHVNVSIVFERLVESVNTKRLYVRRSCQDTRYRQIYCSIAEQKSHYALPPHVYMYYV